MLTTLPWSRRTFLIFGLAGFAVHAQAVCGRAEPLLAEPDRGQGPCATATPRAVLVDASEPGTRLLVRGRLFAADGERPVAGAILYAYQTDVTGVYNPKAGPPRLRGFMKTDAEGRFEYDTIRPGSYPGTNIAAHVHHRPGAVVSRPNGSPTSTSRTIHSFPPPTARVRKPQDGSAGCCRRGVSRRCLWSS